MFSRTESINLVGTQFNAICASKAYFYNLTSSNSILDYMIKYSTQQLFCHLRKN